MMTESHKSYFEWALEDAYLDVIFGRSESEIEKNRMILQKTFNAAVEIIGFEWAQLKMHEIMGREIGYEKFS